MDQLQNELKDINENITKTQLQFKKDYTLNAMECVRLNKCLYFYEEAIQNNIQILRTRIPTTPYPIYV